MATRVVFSDRGDSGAGDRLCDDAKDEERVGDSGDDPEIEEPDEGYDPEEPYENPYERSFYHPYR
jgi:hypothetical protein